MNRAVAATRVIASKSSSHSSAVSSSDSASDSSSNSSSNSSSSKSSSSSTLSGGTHREKPSSARNFPPITDYAEPACRPLRGVQGERHKRGDGMHSARTSRPRTGDPCRPRLIIVVRHRPPKPQNATLSAYHATVRISGPPSVM
ncbi:MAG: hypothetical protein CXX73_01165 [Methanobacteriota archaeon]|nr:MAG: hypothetical protein CXX73_01165 [Euryarchaeota archaeon]